MKYITYSILCLFFASSVYTQELLNLKHKKLAIHDTIILDSVPIIPGSVNIFDKHFKRISENCSKIKYAESMVIFHEDCDIDSDSIIIIYRFFKNSLFEPKFIYRKEDYLTGGRLDSGKTGFSVHPDDLKQNNYSSGSLSRRGSISRGISFGNNQDVIVNSTLNLQLEGKLTENLSIVAAITDNNIPIQPDGTAQQIQEFDKVFIKIFSDDFSLIAGDFEERKPSGYFMNYFKKVQGARVSFNNYSDENNKIAVESSVSGAVAKGKSNRMEFNGTEGNQGPYRLIGANNEYFIIVLAGTERVFIDGILLTRGQDNDYVVDYNLGELTFTSNQPINKDKRIIIEFEYSDRNYARFLFTNNTSIRTEKSVFWLNMFSEGDSKNQSFDQQLRAEDKLLLSQIGDNILNALIPGFDSVGFSNEEIRYMMVDTLFEGILYDSVFIYSTDENLAHYLIRFAFTGQGNGNYRKSISSANGRVFEWVAPINGMPQGDYMPMRLIVTPKKKQMISIGGITDISEKTILSFDIALSNNDLNTFSELDAEDNMGAAIRIELSQQIIKTEKNRLTATAGFENTGKNFEAIEQYRAQEFRRDWNLSKINSDNNEYISSIGLSFLNHKSGNANFKLNHLFRTNEYSGIRNSLESAFRIKKWSLIANAGLLNSSDQINDTRFLRHNLQLLRDVGVFVLGITEQQENNLWTNPEKDSIRSNSFNFNQLEVFIKTNDTIRNASLLSYKFRKDNLPLNNQMQNSTDAHDFTFKTSIVNNNIHRFSGSLNYRKLFVKDTLLYSAKPEDNMTGRIEHSLRLLKGLVSTGTFYEIGSGLERKIDFSYIEVAPGQGVYTWTDYNNNGIQELDEFEIAFFADQANYIRIISPGSEYIKTYSNMFNQQININPAAVWRNTSGVKKFLSRFSNQFAYRLSGKNTSSEFKEFANPFAVSIEDEKLVSMTSSIRNNFSFNKFNPKFNVEYIFQSNSSKVLLASGYDSRKFLTNNLQISSQLSQTLRLQNNISLGNKEYLSEFFSNKDYNINLISNNSSIIFQPNVNNRININYIYQIKDNITGDERLAGHNIGIEYRMSSINKGTFNIQTNYVFFGFDGETNSSVAYEMLEGLMPGSNFTWTLGFQRQLANGLQININYNGRKSKDAMAVHTGGIQLRAFF